MAFLLLFGGILPDRRLSFWQQTLRQAWVERNPRKEWIVFLIRSYLHKKYAGAFEMGDELEMGDEFEMGDAPKYGPVPLPPMPSRTQFEQAVLYFLKHEDQARLCGNSECERPISSSAEEGPKILFRQIR